jgi:hypothetical protein
MIDINKLVNDYVSVWNESDTGIRQKKITELWAKGGFHFTQSIESHGYAEIEDRITKAHEKLVKTGGFIFKSLGNADGHHNTVKFNWEMIPATGGDTLTIGFDFLILDDNGRIHVDYQFIETNKREVL